MSAKSLRASHLGSVVVAALFTLGFCFDLFDPRFYTPVNAGALLAMFGLMLIAPIFWLASNYAPLAIFTAFLVFLGLSAVAKSKGKSDLKLLLPPLFLYMAFALWSGYWFIHPYLVPPHFTGPTYKEIVQYGSRATLTFFGVTAFACLPSLVVAFRLPRSAKYERISLATATLLLVIMTAVEALEVHYRVVRH